VIRVAASLPHFWMSLSTFMIRFTRIRGSWFVNSLACEVLLEGGGVGVMTRNEDHRIILSIGLAKETRLNSI
jgi:hypothetical protein